MSADPLTDGSRPEGRDAQTVVAGFIPLVDCASLVVAAEKGFAKGEGIELSLVREVSWANIRDRVRLGHFDVAHMLAGMPIAASLGIGSPRTPMLAPFSLGLNGNAITVSSELYARIVAQGGENAVGEPAAAGAALKQVVADAAAKGEPPLTFGMVFPFSCHNYQLRYWMAAAGIDPDRDIRLVVIPPPLMVESLLAGAVQGFCVGEPWSSLAVDAGLAHILLPSAALWRASPEKVIGMRALWADKHPETLSALIRALDAAACWADQPANHGELAALLARPEYLGEPAACIARALSGRMIFSTGGEPRPVDDFLVLYRKAANFPWVSQALWLYAQMVRWRQVELSAEREAAVRRVFRPDLYRQALHGWAVPVPLEDCKIEGALASEAAVAAVDGWVSLGPDCFFDARRFDPERLGDYLAALPHRDNRQPPMRIT
jgi:NitT/TauT family transport system ATP-binding protein